MAARKINPNYVSKMNAANGKAANTTDAKAAEIPVIKNTFGNAVLAWHKMENAADRTPAIINQMRLYVGDRFEDWLKTAKPGKAALPTLDRETVRRYTDELHKLLKGDNAMQLDYLAAMVAVKLNEGTNSAAVKKAADNIKALAAEKSDVWHLQVSGPRSTLYRLKDERNKATKVEVPATKPRKARGTGAAANGASTGASKTVQRFGDWVAKNTSIIDRDGLAKVAAELGKNLTDNPPTRAELVAKAPRN